MEDGEVPKLTEVRLTTPPVRSKLNFKRLVKIAIPHLGLYLFLFIFLLGGAWAFRKIEDSEDRRRQAEKVNRIKEVYQDIRDESAALCHNSAMDDGFDSKIYASLSRLSSFMEGRPFEISDLSNLNTDELMPPRWDKMSAILYSLSILTTTGYAAASPQTVGGQLFAIAYGLVGIPLMVLAAVDIGRFLSDVVLFIYSKALRSWKRLKDMLGFTAKKQQMIELVEIKTIKPQRRRSKRRISRKKRPRSWRKNFGRKETDPNAKRLPLSVNAAILLLFCCLGGLVYLAAGGNQKSFIEAFFITFNLVANLTMSEMPNDLSHALTLIYIILFVTCGLAVLSMCADLAASELKWLFLKIHYFGRKINWKRKVRKNVHEQLEVEVKELLKIIEQIRRKYPEKDRITSSDILQYMHDQRGDRPSWICITHHRRDTIAFMPQSIETLRFADEMDQDEQHSHRSISRSEETRV